MFKYLRNNRGSIAVIVAGGLIMLLGCTALVTDIGMLAYRKNIIQKACDAAALAGAQELPKDTTKAENAANLYATNNGVGDITVSFAEENHKITVEAEEQVDFFFAKALGISYGNVSAHAAAIIAPLSKVGSGLRPFGILYNTYTKGTQITLKEGVENASGGNFQPVILDGPGGKTYVETIESGCTEPHYVGETIYTKTGNMSNPSIKAVEDLIAECKDGCTFDNYTEGCPRVITVPLIDTLDVNGSKPVTIKGFAVFFLQDIKEVNEEIVVDGKTKKIGHVEIKGIFLEEVDTGGSDPDQEDFGYRSVKLVE